MDNERPGRSDGSSGSKTPPPESIFPCIGEADQEPKAGTSATEDNTPPGSESTTTPDQARKPKKRAHTDYLYPFPIMQLHSEVINIDDVNNQPEEDLDSESPIPNPYDELIISRPNIVVPPHLVTMALGNRKVKFIMRREKKSRDKFIWNVRKYNGRNRNPTDWEPVRTLDDSSESEDSDDDSDMS